MAFNVEIDAFLDHKEQKEFRRYQRSQQRRRALQALRDRHILRRWLWGPEVRVGRCFTLLFVAVLVICSWCLWRVFA